MKKVLLTGGTGLIGKEAVAPLLENGFEVFAITQKRIESKLNTHWLQVDLFNYEKIRCIFQKIKPKYLLHFAWYTGEGYLDSDLNYKFSDASMHLLKAFKENGGKRAIFAGTCAEYEKQEELIKETDNINPVTIYAKCKNELREKAELYAKENSISFGWGRIFFVYGHGENEKRLTGNILSSIKNNQKIKINNGNLIRDYMYSKDIAAAFVKFLDSDIQSCVNICSGHGISIKDFALKIAKCAQKEHLIKIEHCFSDQTPFIVGDAEYLEKSIKYKSKYRLSEAIAKIWESYK